MSCKAKRLTKPWRPIGHEAVYRLPNGDYAVVANRLPLFEVREFGIAEAWTETTVRVPSALIGELVEAYVCGRRRRRVEWLPKGLIEKLKSWRARQC